MHRPVRKDRRNRSALKPSGVTAFPLKELVLQVHLNKRVLREKLGAQSRVACRHNFGTTEICQPRSQQLSVLQRKPMPADVSAPRPSKAVAERVARGRVKLRLSWLLRPNEAMAEKGVCRRVLELPRDEWRRERKGHGGPRVGTLVATHRVCDEAK